MRKTLLTVIACCMAVSSAFSQIKYFNLSEPKTGDKQPIFDTFENEIGTIFCYQSEEPDGDGRSKVQLVLENKSETYSFYLFNYKNDKKWLRQYYLIPDKHLPFNSTSPVERIHLDKDIIEVKAENYYFPEITIEDGKCYDCTIPIHIAEPKRCLFNKNRKKIIDIKTYQLKISVNIKDEFLEQCENECKKLLSDFSNDLFQHELFCTNSKHKPSFYEQYDSCVYAKRMDTLETKISDYLSQKNWPTGSKKYMQYSKLLAWLDKSMSDTLEVYKNENHDCGKHKPKTVKKCKYCDMSLEEIHNEMNLLHLKLTNKKLPKEVVLPKVEAMYNCCTQHKQSSHAQSWKDDDTYKSDIIDIYRRIKKEKF